MKNEFCLIIASAQQVGWILVQHPNNALNENLPLEKWWWLFGGLAPGVIHYSFLPNGVSITADVYCEELNTMMEKLAHLQLAFNRSSPLLLHDNVRPYTAQQTVSKLQELGLEAHRINKLPLRWQRCIDCMGNYYFD